MCTSIERDPAAVPEPERIRGRSTFGYSDQITYDHFVDGFVWTAGAGVAAEEDSSDWLRFQYCKEEFGAYFNIVRLFFFWRFFPVGNISLLSFSFSPTPPQPLFSISIYDCRKARSPGQETQRCSLCSTTDYCLQNFCSPLRRKGTRPVPRSTGTTTQDFPFKTANDFILGVDYAVQTLYAVRSHNHGRASFLPCTESPPGSVEGADHSSAEMLADGSKTDQSEKHGSCVKYKYEICFPFRNRFRMD